MKTNVISFVVLSFIVSLTPVKAETLVSQQIKENKYPATEINNYLKACVPKATEQGLSPQEAQRLCQCTIKEFQKRYTLTEYKKLEQQANINPQAADKLIDVGAYCFEELFI
jgi:hypothetical protein